MNTFYLVLTTILVVGLLVLPGCAKPGPTPPVIVTPVDHTVVVQQTSALIRTGTQTAVAIGLTAVPKKEEADAIATQAYNVCNKEILPLLNGDNVALANGLKDILALKAFNTPTLAKAKVIVEAVLPLVMSYVPPDAASTGQIPPDVKAYLISFFTGVKDGCASYLGGAPSAPTVTLKALEKKGFDYKALREKLAK
jgi:hypothetical protein